MVKTKPAWQAALSAVALGAAVMLVVTVTHHSRQAAISNAQFAAPASSAPETSSTPETESSSPQLETQSSPSPTPQLSPAESAALADRLEDAVDAKAAGAQVGMEVYDRQTNTVVTSLHSAQAFHSMSVVKLLIAIDVVARDNGTLPDAATRERITQMLSTSDDDIASSLWVSEGEDSIITRDVRLMGLTGTQPPSTAGEWGDTTITAADLVRVYQYVEDQLPASAHDLIYHALFTASPLAADGTDQYFGIPDGIPGSTWAIKQGWGSSGSTAYFNTTGLVGPDSRYVVIVLTSASLGQYRALPGAVTAGTAQLASVVRQ